MPPGGSCTPGTGSGNQACSPPLRSLSVLESRTGEEREQSPAAPPAADWTDKRCYRRKQKTPVRGSRDFHRKQPWSHNLSLSLSLILESPQRPPAPWNLSYIPDGWLRGSLRSGVLLISPQDHKVGLVLRLIAVVVHQNFWKL